VQAGTQRGGPRGRPCPLDTLHLQSGFRTRVCRARWDGRTKHRLPSPRPLRASRMSTTAGSSSNSVRMEAAMSSASARERSTHAAMISPTKWTLSTARIGSRECLKPLIEVAALIGLTLARSSAVTTVLLCFSGMETDFRRHAQQGSARTQLREFRECENHRRTGPARGESARLPCERPMRRYLLPAFICPTTASVGAWTEVCQLNDRASTHRLPPAAIRPESGIERSQRGC